MKWQQLLSAARNRCVTSTGLIPPSSSLCSSLLRIPAETFARVSEFPDLEENRWCGTPGGVIPHGIMEMLPWGSAQLRIWASKSYMKLQFSPVRLCISCSFFLKLC